MSDMQTASSSWYLPPLGL